VKDYPANENIPLTVFVPHNWYGCVVRLLVVAVAVLGGVGGETRDGGGSEGKATVDDSYQHFLDRSPVVK